MSSLTGGGILDNNLEPSYDVPDPTNPNNWPDPRVNQDFIIAFDEIYAGRAGEPFRAGTSYPRSYVRKFRARLNPNDPDLELYDDTDILNDGRCPRPFASYVSNWSNLGLADALALATDFSCEREFPDDAQTWIVTIRYSLDVGEGGPDFRFMFAGTQFGQDLLDPDNPMYKPWYQLPVFEYGAMETTVAEPFDQFGNPYLNSAGDPLTPAPMIEVAYPTLTVIRNEAVFTPATITQWSYALNNAPFMGYPIGCVQLMPPTAKVVWYGSQKYYRVNWKMRFRNNPLASPLGLKTVAIWGDPFHTVTWQPLFLDAGFYESLPSPTGDGTKIPVPIWRGNQRVSNTPALLDGEGRKALPGDPPIFIEYQSYPYQDFTQLFNNSMSP